VLEVSDSYALKENGTKIAMFSAGLPDIQIQVPCKHDLLQTLEVHITAGLCIAQEFRVQLLYRAFEVFSRVDSKVVAKTSTILHTAAVRIPFSCENFANAGFYRVQLVNSLGHVIQVIIFVQEISITSEQASLSVECSQFDIFYEKYCFELVSVDIISDTFHLWRSICVSTEPESVGFPSSFWIKMLIVAYTTALMVIVLSRKLPNFQRTILFLRNIVFSRTDGSWGSWSAWTDCSKTCGTSVQKRYRFCENPKPERGKNCKGQVIETRACKRPMCQELDNVPPTVENCTCGCEMNGRSGSFFTTAADAYLCSGNRTWSMRSSSHSVVSDFKITADVNALGKLFFFIGSPFEELVWFSGSNQDQEFTLQVDRPIFIVFWYNGNTSLLQHRKGFTVVYSTRDAPTHFPLRGSTKFYSLHSETLVISSLFISFLLIIFIPPFLCATITKKLRHHSIREHSAIDKVYNSGMIQSGNTETTQVYGEKSTGFISKKSIGIQLSMQNTPRLSRVGVQAESPLPRGTSSMSASDELEYDYYDGTTIPGSLLAPVNGHMTSIIDIDQIIGESSIFSTRDEGQNTQNQI
ncbi:hypothetical protein Angca_007429, partial [Angiostrongylus cantonensis]